MSKTTCPNCGHKNKASTMICSQCGNYLGDTESRTEERYSITNQPVQEPEPEPEPVKEEVKQQPHPDSGDTIVVETRGSLFRFFPMIIYAAILAVYLVTVHFFYINPYYFMPILLLLFITPQLARKFFFPVKFNATGFNVPHDGRYMEFQYNEISNAVVKVPQRGIQMVTLAMDKRARNVTLDFDQMLSLRQFLSQLNRRRIPISIERENAAPN